MLPALDGFSASAVGDGRDAESRLRPCRSAGSGTWCDPPQSFPGRLDDSRKTTRTINSTWSARASASVRPRRAGQPRGVRSSDSGRPNAPTRAADHNRVPSRAQSRGYQEGSPRQDARIAATRLRAGDPARVRRIDAVRRDQARGGLVQSERVEIEAFSSIDSATALDRAGHDPANRNIDIALSHRCGSCAADAGANSEHSVRGTGRRGGRAERPPRLRRSARRSPTPHGPRGARRRGDMANIASPPPPPDQIAGDLTARRTRDSRARSKARSRCQHV